jgi:ABC-type multidrug transport system fused ATPase/permease subunit
MALSFFSVFWGLSMVMFVDPRLGLLYTFFCLQLALALFFFNLRNNKLSTQLRAITGRLAAFMAERLTAYSLIKSFAS